MIACKSALSLLGDANTGTIIKFEMLEPEDDAIVMLAEILIGFIFQFGAPKEIRVSNIIVEADLNRYVMYVVLNFAE